MCGTQRRAVMAPRCKGRPFRSHASSRQVYRPRSTNSLSCGRRGIKRQTGADCQTGRDKRSPDNLLAACQQKVNTIKCWTDARHDNETIVDETGDSLTEPPRNAALRFECIKIAVLIKGTLHFDSSLRI